VQALTAQVAEKEHTVQALSALVAEKDQHIQNLSQQIGAKDHHIQNLSQQIEALGTQVSEKEQSAQALKMQVAEKERNLQLLNLQLAEKEQAVYSLANQVVENRHAIQALSMQEAQKEGSIQGLMAQVTQKEQSLHAIKVQVAEREQNLAEINNSKAWKIALFFLRTRVLLAPLNSRRTRMLRFLIKPIVKVRMLQKIKKDLTLMRSSGLFDAAWYLAHYPEIARAKVDPLFHYLHAGGFEGRDPGPNFSSAWYLEEYEDVKKAGINPLVHYLKQGREEGRHPNFENYQLALIRSSGLFDDAWYLANNTDVAQEKVDPLFHYLHAGGFEGRDPGPNFCSAWYLDAYEDVKNAGINPLIHYLKSGWEEGYHPNFENYQIALIRPSGLFDEPWYLAHYPEIARAKVDPLFHYLHAGGFEGRDPGPNFSSAWYLDNYKDVKKSGINPLVHYLKQGKEAGFHPNFENYQIALIRSSGLFDEAWYLAHYPEIARAKVDPLFHYLHAGGFEGRDPGPNFYSAWYLDAYKDVKKAGNNPLVHYLKQGRKEGRHPTLENYDIALIRSSVLFDEAWYLANNPEAAQAKLDPLLHYLREGGFQGRDPGPNFSSAWYLDAYEDVKKASINPLVHYLKYGRKAGRSPNNDIALIRSSGLFDEAWYLANNPEAAQAKVDPVLHYLREGGFQGRDPGPNFSSAWYLDAYEEVKKAGINPLVHYLKQGREEGRHPTLENYDIALIRSSGLFDAAWYLAHYPEIARAKVDPLLHYLREGGFQGRDPGPNFSSAWYLDAYEDVKKAGINPLVHYLKYGRKAGRSPNNDIALIRSSGLFDETWYLANNPDVAQAKVDPLLHYLSIGGFEGRDPGPNFSSAWYLDTYSDVKNTGINPLVHYLMYGKQEGRASQPVQTKQDLDLIKSSTLFDQDWYLAIYPDVAQAKVDPYQHYLQHGIFEGRSGIPPIYEAKEGSVGFDPSRDTVLVVSHEASRTGAPILSLNIVQNLQKKYNVVSVLLGPGSIAECFCNASTFLVGPLPAGSCYGSPVLVARAIDQVAKLYKIKFAIVNSIVSYAALPALARWFIPTISLIHEFSTYSRPRGILLEAILWSNELIFSASMTHENAVIDYPELENHPFHIIPQGHCAFPIVESDAASLAKEDTRVIKALRPEGLPADTVVVLGVGSVEIRKGVDLFINCAASVVQSCRDKNFRFVWIGNGYDPDVDMQYSIYLAEQIHRAGLQDHIFILEETSSIEAAYKAANILLLSSRMDPLPNVAIDAMIFKLPLVCFENSTGIADILIANGLGEECVVPYMDTVKMAAKAIAFAKSKSFSKKVGKQLRQVALKEFNMENYISKLEKIGLASSNLIAQEQSDVSEIIKSGLARLDFFMSPRLQIPPDIAIRYYVRTWVTGISRRKLFPGFHPGIFMEQYGLFESGSDPLANYLRAGKPAGDWEYNVITSEENSQPIPPEVRIALHLNVNYPDLLPEMLKRLNENQVRPDLFISVPTESVRDEVQNKLLPSYSGKVIKIRVVPNFGRDIGTFLTAFGTAFVDHYDMVGHLHIKKSANIKDKRIDEEWNTFLQENLLGGKKNMADIILWHMATDSTIGIIFPDDPYVVGWEHNRPCAEALGQKLGLNALPENLLFPVGTMFWARVKSLLPIFNLGLDWQDYPTESFPYDDGSISQALERLLPLVASSQGFRSVVTNVTGITR